MPASNENAPPTPLPPVPEQLSASVKHFERMQLTTLFVHAAQEVVVQESICVLHLVSMQVVAAGQLMAPDPPVPIMAVGLHAPPLPSVIVDEPAVPVVVEPPVLVEPPPWLVELPPVVVEDDPAELVLVPPVLLLEPAPLPRPARRRSRLRPALASVQPGRPRSARMAT